jgi:hypothetical protein
VGFVVDKVALGQVFLRLLRFFPCQYHSTGAPLLGEGQKIIIIIVIFITGLHKKPQGCGASVASAAGPFTTTKNNLINNCLQVLELLHMERQNILTGASCGRTRSLEYYFILIVTTEQMISEWKNHICAMSKVLVGSTAYLKLTNWTNKFMTS